jgi:hypothetical protein
MNAKEFRLGNLIHWESKNGVTKPQDIPINWSMLGNIALKNVFINDYSLILLTEEWLLKFGFKKLKQNTYIKYNSDVDFSLSIYVRQEYCDWSVNGYAISTIKYVHQLQNLFSAMSNEDLQLSST